MITLAWKELLIVIKTNKTNKKTVINSLQIYWVSHILIHSFGFKLTAFWSFNISVLAPTVLGFFLEPQVTLHR